jgi:branched-chain amino acid aminotransferase
MAGLVWLNGETSSIEDAKTHVADHAHLYGDGLFEGIRIYGNKVFKLDEHLERLYFGAKYLGFEMEFAQEEMRKLVLETCSQAGISDGYIRLNVTRGTGLGLDPSHIDRKPNVMVMVSTLALYPPEAYEVGLKVVTCSYRVMTGDTLDPRLKCIGRYAANILAKQEANRQGAGEGLMLNLQGHVAECTGDNVFVVKEGLISTPHKSSGMLLGITRNTVIGLAREAGYEVREEFLTRYDILEADEVFLTGTAAEVIPMCSLDGQPIGTGKAGPISRKLMGLYREETQNGVPF